MQRRSLTRLQVTDTEMGKQKCLQNDYSKRVLVDIAEYANTLQYPNCGHLMRPIQGDQNTWYCY